MSVAMPSVPAPARPLRALLVDRDLDTRTMYSEFMRQAEWDVDEAADGPEALAKAIAGQPHVVVTETQLGRFSGYELCRVLRDDVATCDIPVVVVTADAYDEDVARAKDAGAKTVLIKPCLPETLLSAVHALIDSSIALRVKSAEVRQRVAAELARSAALFERSQSSRKFMSHAAFRRDTISPPTPPPVPICPECDRSLVYKRSHIGGVSERHLEQWDYFECPGKCGTFQYRARTRKLRKI
jgi:two-component system cell cycle response regulator DivK